MALRVKCELCSEANADLYDVGQKMTTCSICISSNADKTTSRDHCIALKTTTPKSAPKCDICQEEYAVFFCREDRALLCAKCDHTIHNANDMVRSHHRFLFSALHVDQERAGNSLAASGSYKSNALPSSGALSGMSKKTTDLNSKTKYGKTSLSIDDNSRQMERQTAKRQKLSRNESESDLFMPNNNYKNSTSDTAAFESNQIGELLQIPNLAEDYGLKDVDDFGDFSNEEWQDLQYALFEAPQSVPGSSSDEYDLYGSSSFGLNMRKGSSYVNSAYNEDSAVPDFGSG